MKSMVRLYTLWLLLLVCSVRAQQSNASEDWTRLYFQIFPTEQLDLLKDRTYVVFSKESINRFSQLVFSWNAIRPRTGYFSFWVQVRSANSKRWGNWHHMVDWGADFQRSYQDKTDGMAHYNHVRLEMDRGHEGDSFRIKMMRHGGARLDNIKAFAVSCSNLDLFKSETVNKQIKRLPSVHIKHVPTISQFALDHPKNDCICSPTSCSMLAGFLTQHYVDPLSFAEKSFDSGLGVYGSWPFNMAHSYEVCGGAYCFFTARLSNFASLHHRLTQGVPVVVSVRGPLQGAAAPYRSGHLMIVVGWDAKNQEVIVHDPAFKSDYDTVKRYAIADFLEAWERSRRLAYLAEPNH